MALITCPSCSKQISDKHKQCPHCNIEIHNLNADERQRLAADQFFIKKQKLMNHSFIALIIFLSGFLALYTRSAEQGEMELLITQSAIGLGFIWYLINRVRIVFLKKS